MLRNARGFTLMEILVAVAVTGILAAVAIPSVASRTRTFDLAREGRQIHTDISRLRARAVAEQAQYEVVVEEGHAVRIQRREVEGVERTTDAVARTSDLPEGSFVELNGETSGSIVFEPTGRVSSTGDLVMQDGRRKITIRVLASGMTRMITEPLTADAR